jgi:branched-chain amino acid transport system permease protein
MRTTWIFLALIAVVGAIAPLSGLYPLFLMKCMALAIFAIAFNFFTGYVGLLSIGHAAFYGMGAYFGGYAIKNYGITTEIALLIGMATGAVLGLLFGLLAIRRRGIYFAMITLALAQMVYFFCVQAPFTGAEDGLQRIPRGKLFGLIDLSGDLSMYYFTLALLLLALFVAHYLVTAPFGQVLKAIRDNEPRAVSLGYDVQRYKLIAFVLSAALAGGAGSLKAMILSLAGLPDAHWTNSGAVILMCLLGGLGTALGPVVGAVMVVLLETELAGIGVVRIGAFTLDLSTKVPIVIGFIFMVTVLLFRKGIVGEIQAVLENLQRRRLEKSTS